MDTEINSNSSGWIFFVKASFAIALLATGAGVGTCQSGQE